MNKKMMVLAASILSIFLFAGITFAQTCVTIQDGTLKDSASVLLQTGYDDWGYNYQAHIFNGKYCDSYRDAAWCQEYKDVDLEMKWNDAWLSNNDCTGDGLLDRHYGYTTYIGSGAWLTNHQKGTYLDSKSKKQRWTYFHYCPVNFL